MNHARFCASVTVVNEYIYVAGGLDGELPSDKVELYDPKRDEWKQLTSMIKPRYAFSMINSNGFLYAFGHGYTASIERFDTLKWEWKEVCLWSDVKDLYYAIS